MFPQDTAQPLPISWGHDIRDHIEVVDMPDLDLNGIYKEDSINDQNKSSPWRYGIIRSVAIDIEKHGVWRTLESGAKIWLIALKSSDALNISVNFEDIFLPEGSSIQLYGANRNETPLTYSSAETIEVRAMGSWFVEGDIVLDRILSAFF